MKMIRLLGSLALILCMLLTLVPMTSIVASAAAEDEYYYANKYLWEFYEPNPMSGFGGSAELGFTQEAYMNSPLGEWFITQNQYKALGSEDEMSDAIVQHWAMMGMKKELYDNGTKFSIFTPLYQPEGKVFPVMFVCHMGGGQPYDAEWYGYVEVAAKRGYIVVCLDWDDLPNPVKGQTVYYENGYSRESSCFLTALDEIRANKYPIDETQMYVSGISGGGNAAAFIAIECSDLIAATAPATGAAVQGSGVATGDYDIYEKLAEMQKHGMALMMPYGLMDVEQRWPITEALQERGLAYNLTVPERLENMNIWLSACGATSASTTIDEMSTLIASGKKTASSVFGLKFDKEYTKDLEVPYYFGDYLNADGNAIVRFMGVEDNPHLFSPSWASEFMDFCENFSRDPVTHKLIVSEGTSDDVGYTDVPTSYWAYDPITKWSSQENGVLEGNEDGTFAPDQGLTRNELSLILSRAFGYTQTVETGGTLTREEAIKYIAAACDVAPANDNTDFADDDDISAVYKPYVNAFKRLGYVVGKGNDIFDPKAPFTRAEAMQVIDNVTKES